jgi:hypothetical protein
MYQSRTILFPAALLGCLVVIWVGTMAARGLPTGVVDPSSGQVALVSTHNGPPESQTGKDQVTSSGGDASKNSSKGCTISTRYPESIRRWCGLIEKYAGEHGLPAQLIAAVMLQESGGDPNAYSRDGAVGLLQVMPRDGRAASFQCSGKPCFASRPAIEELKNPEFNLDFGTGMLSGLLSRHGNFRKALKYYGPSGVDYAYADKVLAIYESYQ